MIHMTTTVLSYSATAKAAIIDYLQHSATKTKPQHVKSTSTSTSNTTSPSVSISISENSMTHESDDQ